MLTVGVDLSETERVAYLVERYGERFVNRVFTAQEQAYCNGRITSLTARFAIKEAVAKALGTGIGEIVTWRDIEVINDPQGKPELVLHNKTKAYADSLGLRHWAISLSHTDALAIGFVVATE
ncbi:MAG: holo-ACP synthase [Ardenticatenaceae bacterium]|nr:holo-ACP synthase [Anaerolineales bacterium]MCB8921370.1 holo-ACP synthase [Ardenticatenaceae bacterium]MCB8991492.1 holo-ACP synthase [Ardenticatenaceae bacterium]MCB9004006.1 holo-ACP synthase [Ardenticatenaceae bacterium]